jgi:hypothetical protein
MVARRAKALEVKWNRRQLEELVLQTSAIEQSLCPRDRHVVDSGAAALPGGQENDMLRIATEPASLDIAEN